MVFNLGIFIVNLFHFSWCFILTVLYLWLVFSVPGNQLVVNLGFGFDTLHLFLVDIRVIKPRLCIFEHLATKWFTLFNNIILSHILLTDINLGPLHMRIQYGGNICNFKLCFQINLFIIENIWTKMGLG